MSTGASIRKDDSDDYKFPVCHGIDARLPVGSGTR